MNKVLVFANICLNYEIVKEYSFIFLVIVLMKYLFDYMQSLKDLKTAMQQS